MGPFPREREGVFHFKHWAINPVSGIAWRKCLDAKSRAKHDSDAHRSNVKKLFLLLISIWFSTGASWAADEVPPPLVPKLAAVPFWTNATIDNVMTYASGKIFREEMTQTARTVDGRYVIFTVQSRFYKQPVSSILTYDEGNSALRMYGFFDDGKGDGILTEGTVVYDFAKKSYTITSSYGDAFKETTTGSDPSTKTTEKTRCIKTVPGS